MKYFVSYFAQTIDGALIVGNSVMESSREIQTDTDIAQLQEAILESVNTEGLIASITIINYKEM